MAKKVAEQTISLIPEDPSTPRPRLNKLIIRNFRCIGNSPVSIELDDIVVLVGPNNVGKSSILRAYEVVMSHGSAQGKLNLGDFPNGKIDPKALPEIELHTVVYDNAPGERWIQKDENGEMIIRERWIWSGPGDPKRQGFDIEKNDWDDQVPWGAPNVANSRRPQPHRIDAFADPLTQANEIINLLQAVLKDRVKDIQSVKDDEEEKSEFSTLLEQIRQLQKKIVEESQAQIEAIETEVSELVGKVFPGYKVRYDARPEDDLDKTISLFKANPQLLMGPEDGYQSTIDRQGSGARRTLMWSALRIVSESKNPPKPGTILRPHVLLLDEPELCLHPNAIREACNVLYDLPKTGNWQVMVTTHSPAFIDVSRDNTTIVRVEISSEGDIRGTTVFRPNRAQLDDNDRRRLKLMNLCDPYVTEFFFGGRSIIVEGDTEYTAFKYVMAENPEEFKDVHIIRARGKATIISLIKILNHFGSGYTVLHDSDTSTIQTKIAKKERKNPAWIINQNILDAIKLHPTNKVRLIASVTNFEKAFLGEEVEDEKPYNALIKLKDNPLTLKNIQELLRALVDHTYPIPPKGYIEWTSLEELENAIASLG